MCRSIKTLRTGATPASDEEIRAAALQFVRKISGFRSPAPHNAETFEAAVDEIAEASEKLLGSLKVRGRSEEHTSELQSRLHLVCRLLLEKKKILTMS